jgi:hypothetical protein
MRRGMQATFRFTVTRVDAMTVSLDAGISRSTWVEAVQGMRIPRDLAIALLVWSAPLEPRCAQQPTGAVAAAQLYGPTVGAGAGFGIGSVCRADGV